MGMECVRSSSPVSSLVRPWFSISQSSQNDAEHREGVIEPRSAPPSLFSSFVACRRAASFPLASAALANATTTMDGTSVLKMAANCNGHGNSALKVRSQSESAALNKLALRSARPRTLLDEFELWQNRRASSFGGNTETGDKEVKFYAQQLQSDSEGEDSLVSPDEEVASPSTSCCEEERENGPNIETLDDLMQQFEDFGAENVEQVEQEQIKDLGRLLGGKTIFPKSSGSFLPRHMPPALEDAAFSHERSPSPHRTSPICPMATSDYITVPRILASMDIAQPAEPSPPVQLPFQVPLVRVDLNFRRPSVEVAKLEANDTLAPILRQMGRLKKNVRFADDCGQCLETVRVMTEPSDYPPKISPAVLRRFRRAAAATMAFHCGGHVKVLEEDSDEPDEDEQAKRRKSSAWKMTFKQPASEYIRFRDTLDKQKVALENVMLKNELGRMIGTIKVANISFEKRVFIRFTSDAWNSFKDQPAQYQSSPSKTFDTFRFDIELPRNEGSTRRIEFCVCFVAGPNGLEHWDSNGGKNFALTSPDEPPSSFCSQPFSPTDLNHNNAPFGTQKSQPRPIEREDAYRMDWNSPTGCLSTQFGAWKQLPTDGPYWSSTTPPLNAILTSD